MEQLYSLDVLIDLVEHLQLYQLMVSECLEWQSQEYEQSYGKLLAVKLVRQPWQTLLHCQIALSGLWQAPSTPLPRQRTEALESCHAGKEG